MRTLPTTIVQVLAPFVPHFSERVWAKEDRSFRTQSGGSATREALLPLPSGLEPGLLVKPASKPRTARVAR